MTTGKPSNQGNEITGKSKSIEMTFAPTAPPRLRKASTRMIEKLAKMASPWGHGAVCPNRQLQLRACAAIARTRYLNFSARTGEQNYM